MSDSEKILFCYVSGMDVRRIDEARTPFLHAWFGNYPLAPFQNLPSNELLPTMITGVDPTVHGVWGVKLKDDSTSSGWERFLDRIPDSVTTGVQCILHRLTGEFDLSAIPPGRRRRFVITRTKYKRRRGEPDALVNINGVDTLFGILGRENCRYRFHGSENLDKLLTTYEPGAYALDLLELYSLDRFQQWHLDRPESVDRYYGRIDDCLRVLHDKCRLSGVTLLIVSDHGHEAISNSIDLMEGLRGLGLEKSEYSYFLEVSSVRLWFHTEEARRKIGDYLRRLSEGTLIHFSEMERYSIPLSDSSYGELFFFLHPGHIFFPHDFQNSLTNFYFSLSDSMQRGRFLNPRHRGNHGHLPHFDAEKSFALLLDDRFTCAGHDGHVLDMAPTILSLLGRHAHPPMTGRPLFVQKEIE